MKRFKPLLLLIFFLLSMSNQTMAQDVTTATIKQLEQEMYRLYPTRNVDEFMDVTERLKEASLKAGEEGLFYRTWSNQATFIFSKINRQKGMEIAKAMNDYSQQHDSKLGIYYSSLTNASHLSSLRMEEEALELYLKAIQYKQQYLPSVNAAAAYLGAAKIYYNFRQKEKILEMTDKALTEPDTKGAHIVDAWSWRCLAAMMPDGVDHKEEMNQVYEEWKKAKEKYKYNSSWSNIIEIYHAQVNGDYEKMLEYAKEVKSPQDRYIFMSHAYEWLGQWDNALNCYKERIESELRIARDIQMNMLPQRFPQRSDIDIFGSMRAAKEVGGDLYDFFFQDEKLFFCVGDVSGKGVPAALFMANTISLFRTVAKEGISPASIANRLNEALGLDNENGMFVTMFIGIVDLVTGHLDFCNAGHNPPIIIADGQSRYMEMESNAPIGLWPELEFIDEHIDSVMGQVLVIYTDGVNEAENKEMAQFGDDRLLELLNKKENHTAKQFIDRILEDVALHVGDAEPSDDLTLLCLKINGKTPLHKETI